MSAKLLKLIKQDLTEYGIFVLSSIGFIFASWMIELIVRMVFDWGEGTIFIGLFHMGSFVAITIIMFICGIVAGAEIPAGVRKGISRIESFISESVSAVIVNLLIGPLLLILSMVFQILPGTSTVIVEWSIGALVVLFFMYMAAFFVGMFIAILWQRIGWLLTVALIVITVPITGRIGLGVTTTNVTTTAEHVDISLDNLGYVVQEVVDNTVEGNQMLFEINYNHVAIFVALPIILIFGTATYLMIKKLPVRTI